MLIQLIYMSSATSWPTEQDLTELLHQARHRNLDMNITGMLLYKNATYLQVLEGDDSNIYEVFRSINKDSRNVGVVKLSEEPIAERCFPDWTMGFENLDAVTPQELHGYTEVLQDNDLARRILANKSLAKQMLLSFATKH